MIKAWFRGILFWLIIASFARYIFLSARMGRFGGFANMMTSVSGVFLVIAVIGVVFFFFCIAMLKTMLATADVSETIGTPASSAPRRAIQPTKPEVELSNEEVKPVVNHSAEVKPAVNYKKIASEIGTEAELRELERKEREELKRLEREGR